MHDVGAEEREEGDCGSIEKEGWLARYRPLRLECGRWLTREGRGAEVADTAWEAGGVGGVSGAG
jgi:hypothetical protein